MFAEAHVCCFLAAEEELEELKEEFQERLGAADRTIATLQVLTGLQDNLLDQGKNYYAKVVLELCNSVLPLCAG
jgi:hypothetical protein